MTDDQNKDWHNEGDTEPVGNRHMFDAVPEIDDTIEAVRQRLRDNGPEVDYELIAGFLEGFLTETEHKDVEQKVGTWVNWHDAYWEVRSYSRWHTE